MRLKYKVFLYLFINYIILNKLFTNDILTNVIYPAILIFFSVIGFLFLDLKKELKYKKLCIYEVIKMTLLYILIFYSSGLFIDYLKTPYGRDTNAFIINFYSILLVVSLKEYIRGILINGVDNKKAFYFFLITLIFILFDINYSSVIKSFSNLESIAILLIEKIFPVIVLNIFLSYLTINGGYLPSLLYRGSLSLVSLIIPVIPDLNVVIVSLIQMIFPFFIFLIIRKKIQIRNKEKQHKEELKPTTWISVTLSLVLIMLFNLGTFNIKPVSVLSQSMKPAINLGDIIILKKCNIEDVKPLDIIEFENKGRQIVHRVINVEKNKKRISLVTKGDNNLNKDKEKVLEENLTGCMVFNIPYLGYPSYILHTIINKEKS